MNESQQAVGVANALSGEKSVRTVTFPITGLLEADLISGIHAVVTEVYDRGSQTRVIMRVMQMLAAEWEDAAKVEERDRQEAMRPISSLGSMGASTSAGLQISPSNLYPGPENPAWQSAPSPGNLSGLEKYLQSVKKPEAGGVP